MSDWMKPWHPPGVDEVRETLNRSAASLPHTEEHGLDPLPPEKQARLDASAAQNRFEEVERAREQGRQEALNKDQFKEGWEAAEAERKRRNEAARAQRASQPKAPKKPKSVWASFKAPSASRTRSTGFMLRSTRSAGSAFRRKR